MDTPSVQELVSSKLNDDKIVAVPLVKRRNENEPRLAVPSCHGI